MEDIRHRVGVLVKFCVALHREVQWQRMQHADDAGFETEETHRICADLMAAYEATCLTVMSRLLQIIRWRPVLRDFMHALPMVPAACLHTLQLLIFTRQVGDFSWICLLFPIPVLFFLAVFVLAILNLEKGTIRWKGRTFSTR